MGRVAVIGAGRGIRAPDLAPRTPVDRILPAIGALASAIAGQATAPSDTHELGGPSATTGRRARLLLGVDLLVTDPVRGGLGWKLAGAGARHGGGVQALQAVLGCAVDEAFATPSGREVLAPNGHRGSRTPPNGSSLGATRGRNAMRQIPISRPTSAWARLGSVRHSRTGAPGRHTRRWASRSTPKGHRA